MVYKCMAAIFYIVLPCVNYFDEGGVGDYISSNIYTDMIVFCFLEINRRELFKFAAIPHN